MASVAGVFLGGVISAGPGWRWVLFVNLPVCAMVLAAAFRLLPADTTGRFGKKGFDLSSFDVPGGILGTGGMLLLIFALVRAPDEGWGAARTIGEFAAAAALLTGFVLNERRHRNPLVPLSIFRIKGLAAADATQVIAMAGFYSAFFFLTLYMPITYRFSIPQPSRRFRQ